MKKTLLVLSAACLGFCFIKDHRDEAIAAATAKAIANSSATDESPEYAHRATSTSSVVTAANAFKALLSATQLSSAEHTYTTALAQNWSNLPCGASCRNGIEFNTLSTAQLAAAKAVIQAEAGTAANEGYDEFNMINIADSILNASSGSGGMGGGGYSSGYYFLSFLNDPSTTGSWMLQYGGHHYAGNISFHNGVLVGATPLFEGVEPKHYVRNGSTTTSAPLDQEQAGMATMLASLTTAQLATAKLSTTFSDVSLGPGHDGAFPAAKVGVAVSTLTAAQKALVVAAMKQWVNDVDAASSDTFMSVYSGAELDSTYIAWSGHSTLDTNADYVRIDGPSVWIEFVCQTGVVFPTQIHYHSIWRDHRRDYGNYLANTSLSLSSGTTGGGTSSVSHVKRGSTVTVYPNPAISNINLSMDQELKKGTVVIVNTMGQVIYKAANMSGSVINVDIAKFATGTYLLRVEDAGTVYSGKFTKL